MTQILWYNNKLFQKYLKEKSASVIQHEADLGTEEYKNLCVLGDSLFYERFTFYFDSTGNIPHPFNIKNKKPYRYEINKLCFEEVCFETAFQILKNAKKNIAINWSGGIDSTVVLLSFLEICETRNITVVLNQNSINEFSEFFYSRIKDQCNIIGFDEFIKNQEDYFLVTGDAGDCVFGGISSTNYYQLNQQQVIKSSWRNFFQNKNPKIIDFIEEFNKHSGVEINTVLELFVWFSISTKWQCCTLLPWAHSIVSDKKKDIVSFFDFNNLFISWSINNLDKLHFSKQSEYKMPAKNFINKYFNNFDYFNNKTKEASTSWSHNSTKRAILENRCASVILDKNYKVPYLDSWPFFSLNEMENLIKTYKILPNLSL